MYEFHFMKNLIYLIIVAAGLFSSSLSAQTRQGRGVKNQIEQARRAVRDKMPKVPQVPQVPRLSVPNVQNSSVIREFKPTALTYKLPKFIPLGKEYQLAFDSLSNDSTATGDDYLQLFYTLGCDSRYSSIGYHLKCETVADKYLDIENPSPERLAEVLAIAQQQFPEQRHINFLQTPSALLLERATLRYYKQVLAADSAFTYQNAVILIQLYDEYWQDTINDGNTLYCYLSELYEYAVPPLEHYFKTFEDYPVSDGYITQHINEIAPKFRLLERCYEAMGFTERRDSLLANPTYQRIIKFETPK